MARGFADKITLVAATATRLSAALAAAGYAGHMAGGYLLIDDLALTDLRRGDDSDVSATVGVAVAGTWERTAPPAIDPGGIWLFSTAGGDISVTFNPL